jgi:hypothetical protein
MQEYFVKKTMEYIAFMALLAANDDSFTVFGLDEEDDLTLLTIMIDQGEYYASLNTPRLSIPDYINHDPINLNTISEEFSYSNTGYSRAEIYRLFLAMG